MPFPPDFVDECLYAQDAWFIHDVLEIDREGGRVVGWIDTTRLGWLVDAQLPRGGHAQHLPGAVAIQVTGTLGALHAIYVLGLRASAGWCGYGTHLHSARFPSMGRIGPPVVATLTCSRARNVRGTVFARYQYRYVQEDRVVFESEQTAAWVRGGVPPTATLGG